MAGRCWPLRSRPVSGVNLPLECDRGAVGAVVVGAEGAPAYLRGRGAGSLGPVSARQDSAWEAPLSEVVRLRAGSRSLALRPLGTPPAGAATRSPRRLLGRDSRPAAIAEGVLGVTHPHGGQAAARRPTAAAYAAADGPSVASRWTAALAAATSTSGRSSTAFHTSRSIACRSA